MQINDDVQIITTGWATAFTQALRDSYVRPYFGITGPLDVNNANTMTQSFAHKTHFEVMNQKYFPWEFQNWLACSAAVAAHQRLRSAQL